MWPDPVAGIDTASFIAAEQQRESGIEAVSGPPSGTFNPWAGDTDWDRARPAVDATLLLAGLLALVLALFPPGSTSSPPRRRAGQSATHRPGAGLRP